MKEILLRDDVYRTAASTHNNRFGNDVDIAGDAILLAGMPGLFRDHIIAFQTPGITANKADPPLAAVYFYGFMPGSEPMTDAMPFELEHGGAPFGISQLALSSMLLQATVQAAENLYPTPYHTELELVRQVIEEAPPIEYQDPRLIFGVEIRASRKAPAVNSLPAIYTALLVSTSVDKHIGTLREMDRELPPEVVMPYRTTAEQAALRISAEMCKQVLSPSENESSEL